MSYWPVWLRDRGMSDSQIGTLFMSRQLVSVLSTLAIGWVAHRLGNTRGVILVLAGAATFLLTGYQFSTPSWPSCWSASCGAACGRRPWRSMTASW